MDIKQLKYFVTVVNMKSFSHAGKHLFVSQSTLSKALQSLEDELGVPLIYFSSKKMYTTSYGTQLYNMAQNMLDQHDAIMDTMHGLSHLERGVIKIGVPPIIGTCVFPRLISSFIEKYPGIEFAIDQHGAYNIQQLVDKNLLEIGFTLLPTISESFDVVNIVSSRYVVVVNKKNRLASCRNLRYRDLHSEKFILLGEEYRMYENLIASCHLADFEPRIVMRLNNWDLILQLVKLNMGITVVPFSIIDMFPDEDLVCVDLDDSTFRWDVVMITPKNHYETIAVKSFKSHITQIYGTGSSFSQSI